MRKPESKRGVSGASTWRWRGSAQSSAPLHSLVRRGGDRGYSRCRGAMSFEDGRGQTAVSPGVRASMDVLSKVRSGSKHVPFQSALNHHHQETSQSDLCATNVREGEQPTSRISLESRLIHSSGVPASSGPDRTSTFGSGGYSLGRLGCWMVE